MRSRMAAACFCCAYVVSLGGAVPRRARAWKIAASWSSGWRRASSSTAAR
jgi:hypothetical protein